MTNTKVATDVAPEVKATLERLAKEKNVTLAALVRDMLTYATSELGGIPKVTPLATLTDPELHHVPTTYGLFVDTDGKALEETDTGWMCPRCKESPRNLAKNRYICNRCGRVYVRN